MLKVKSQKILIIKIGAIGDIVMSLPMLQFLNLDERKCEITWVCGKSVAALVKSIPEISNVVVVDDHKILNGSFIQKTFEIIKTWKTIGFKGFDLTLVGHSNRGYRLFTALTRSKVIRSFGTAPDGHMLPSHGRSHSAEYVRLATGFNGSDLPAPSPYELFQHQPVSKTVGIAPGGAKNLKRDTPHRRWPIGAYVQLAEQLIQRGFAVSIFGGPSDAWVLPAFENLKVKILVGNLSLIETAKSMSEHQLIITHDSGPAHLASLSATPLITLFGPTNPRNFAPLGSRKRFLITRKWLACQPCYDGLECAPCKDFLCMSSISVDQVLK
ncbi:MAG: glycosyltransferase family 9 protein, partial [Proteobacteria bacterium]